MKVKELKGLYKEAREKGKEEFTADGCLLVTDYAKYLIEALDMQHIGDDVELDMTQTIISFKDKGE